MKQIFLSSAALLAMLLLVGCNIETYEEKEVFTLDATDLDSFIVTHEEGEANIVGVDNSEEIKVVATSVAKSEEADLAQLFAEEKIKLNLEREGTTGMLTSVINYDVGEEQGFLNLGIEVPSHLEIDLVQNEEPLKIKSMKADMKIQHGTKSLLFEDIEGNIQVVDGSGPLTMKNVTGDVTVNKNASKATISNVTGDLTLIAGSGDIEIEQITGNVTLRSGTGNIVVHNVNGDVTLLANREGTVDITDVSGTVTLPEE